MAKSWITRCAEKLQRAANIRHELGNMTDPVEAIERPRGLRRYPYHRKLLKLKRLEDEAEDLLASGIGDWQDKNQENDKRNTTTGSK